MKKKSFSLQPNNLKFFFRFSLIYGFREKKDVSYFHTSFFSYKKQIAFK